MIMSKKHVPCNLCGSDGYRLLFKAKDINYKTTDEEFDIVKCTECGLVFVNPRPDDLAPYYPSDYDPHTSGSTIKVKQAVRRMLEVYFNYPAGGSAAAVGAMDKLMCLSKFLEIKLKNEYFFHRIPYERDKKLLDVGCGSGGYLLSLKRLGWDTRTQLFGIDFPNEELKRVKEEEKLNITEGSFFEADLPEGFYDVVTLRHVLEHFEDPTLALKKVYKMLRPGGRVMINVPNFKCIEGRFIFKGNWYQLEPPRHLYHFTPETTKRLLHNVGFDVERIDVKKGPAQFVATLDTLGYRVPKFVEKYIISNMLKVFKMFGYGAEILCVAVKK